MHEKLRGQWGKKVVRTPEEQCTYYMVGDFLQKYQECRNISQTLTGNQCRQMRKDLPKMRNFNSNWKLFSVVQAASLLLVSTFSTNYKNKD